MCNIIQHDSKLPDLPKCTAESPLPTQHPLPPNEMTHVGLFIDAAVINTTLVLTITPHGSLAVLLYSHQLSCHHNYTSCRVPSKPPLPVRAPVHIACVLSFSFDA